jgi:hypothetical protein
MSGRFSVDLVSGSESDFKESGSMHPLYRLKVVTLCLDKAYSFT